jgi:hypothetical protein
MVGGGRALQVMIRHTSGEAMTRNEIKLALKEMEDAYSLRLFLDNQISVLAHGWSLVEEKQEAEEAGDSAASARSDQEGLLRVTVGRRQALIAISRIVVIQRVPFGW